MRKISLPRMTIATLLFILSFSAFANVLDGFPESFTAEQPTSLNDQRQVAPPSLNSDTVPGAYIVVFSKDTLPENIGLTAEERLSAVKSKINKLQQKYRFKVNFIYDACLQGFSAKMDENTIAALAHNPMIESIELDRMAYANVQTLPTGINRIDADRSSTIAGNGSGTVSGVDIFIIDTGIQTNHPDLNVVGGVNFSSGNSYNDLNGHGTHVAGTAAAKDNSSYVVGGAPGANLYAVRVLNSNGSGTFSQVLAGVNWVTNRKLANPSRPMVANMSLGGYVGSPFYNSLDYGIRNSIARGVVYTIAAGNSSLNAIYFSPAHVVEALTIGAYSASSNVWASFSNYGSIIDMLAPGVDVLSTYRGSRTAVMSGTSTSAPHVAGTAALYLSSNSGDTPTQVRTALLNASSNPSPGTNPAIFVVPFRTTNKSVYTGSF